MIIRLIAWLNMVGEAIAEAKALRAEMQRKFGPITE
jgi:hypothetical protein